MIGQYFMTLEPGGRFDMDPVIDDSVEGYDQEIHNRMREAMRGLIESRSETATLVEWWFADENGNRIDGGTTPPEPIDWSKNDGA